MKLIKDVDNIRSEDKQIAVQIMNKLKGGNRVFGNPAEGLKYTLKNLENQLNDLENGMSKLDFMINDADIRENIRMIKAGILGEETLAEYFERIVKYDEILEDIIFFASLSDPEQNFGGDNYISDSDFVAIYGRHVLILDAKNIRTNPEVPIYLDGNTLVSVGGKPIIDLHPSTSIWTRVFNNAGCTIESIKGCVVIVNQSGACVWKNRDWHTSDVQPIHISDLVGYLKAWVDGKEPMTDLSTVTTLSKMQIRKEKTSLDLTNVRRRFKI